MREFTQSQLVEFLKSNMSYSQSAAEQMVDLIFKARLSPEIRKLLWPRKTKTGKLTTVHRKKTVSQTARQSEAKTRSANKGFEKLWKEREREKDIKTMSEKWRDEND